jgi:hypothetical protein
VTLISYKADVVQQARKYNSLAAKNNVRDLGETYSTVCIDTFSLRDAFSMFSTVPQATREIIIMFDATRDARRANIMKSLRLGQVILLDGSSLLSGIAAELLQSHITIHWHNYIRGYFSTVATVMLIHWSSSDMIFDNDQ